jgi:hypothetical protein
MALNLQKAGEDASFCHPRPSKALVCRRTAFARNEMLVSLFILLDFYVIMMLY